MKSDSSSIHRDRPLARCLRPWLALTLAAAAIAGCDDTHKGLNAQGTGHPELNSLSSREMARRLGLNVVNASSTMVTMRNPGNSVILYADPCGQAFVNGRRVGDTGGFVWAGDVLYIPQEVEPLIRRALRDQPGPGLVPPPIGKVRDVPETLVRASGRVVIDPGHGGQDTGTQAGGTPEKSINLSVGNDIAECLKKRGVDAVCTRTDDRFIKLDDRIELANRNNSDLFVAIHSDSSTNKAAEGHTVITPAAYSAKANVAATYISQRLKTAGSPKHAVRTDDRGLHVLKYARVPAVLVELGFLSNPEDSARLCSASCRQKMAEAIADGIVDYLRSKN